MRTTLRSDARLCGDSTLTRSVLSCLFEGWLPSKRRTVSLLVGIISSAIFSTIALGQLQYDHTTFLNGFASDSMIWRTGYRDLVGVAPPAYLSNTVVLRTLAYPDVNDSLTFAQDLARVGPVFTTGLHAVVTHSMGGLVARGIYINNSAARPHITGIVAMVAPHEGTPLAANASEAVAFFADVERRVNNAVNLINIDAVALGLVGWLVPGLSALTEIANIVLLQTWGAQISLGNIAIAPKIPALPDLVPGSPTILALDNNFSDGAIPRANIFATIPHYRAVIRLASSAKDEDYRFNTNVGTFNSAISDFKACKYIAYGVIVFGSTGRACAYAVKVLKRVDGRWVKYVNGVDAAGNPRDIPFDGVVPNEDSHYPSTNALAYEADVVGLNHLNIYKTKQGLDQVSLGMRRIGMLTAGTPPPSLRVSVSSPGSSLVIGCRYTWSASASGGVPPYTYSWLVNTNAVNTNGAPYMDYTPTGPRITVKATATDANHTAASASVSSTANTGSC